MKDSLTPGTPSRLQVATRKIAAEESRLNAAFYLHVDRDRDGRVVGARFKTPGKFADGWVDWFLGLLSRHLEAELSGVEPDPALPYPPPPVAGPKPAAPEAAQIGALVAALQLAFPLLCDSLQSQLDSEARWVGRGWPDGAEVVPGSIDPERAAQILRELAVVQAVAAALGVELPEDLADLLPALPASNDREAAS